jgi:AcrR family transcriptional regulator
MAMYRHFPDKESLLRHLCTELYERFTTRTNAKYDTLSDPKERLRNALQDFLLLSLKNPHHYRLTFLTPSDGKRRGRIREDVAAAAISYFRQNLRQCFRKETPEVLIEQRMTQILALLHGTIAMLISRPEQYRLNKESALSQLESAFELLLTH